jgi:GT2 family glycosyltransferase
MTQPSIAICLPCRDQVNTGFAYDLATLTANWSARNVPSGGKLFMFTSMGTLIANQRQELVGEALNAGASHILFLDTDMRFPKNTIDRLLAHDKPIVAANYATRRLPIKTVAFKTSTDWDCVYTTEDKTGLEPVAAVGMGVMLIKREVFEKIELPWFIIGYNPKTFEFSGEDIFFCRQAKKAGYDILIDHDLSKEVKHIGSFEFAHDHAEACKQESNGDN